jgi:hypothetical protein
MDFALVLIFLNRREVKTIVISTIMGGLLQVICIRYIKNHPEFLEQKNYTLKDETPEIEIKNEKNRFRFPISVPRSGALVEVTAVKIVVHLAVKLIAGSGLIMGFLGGAAVVLIKLPKGVVENVLREALPHNLPHLEKGKCILVDGEKIYFDQCHQSVRYLFLILSDPNVPYIEKENVSRKVLKQSLNIGTHDGRVNFVLCISIMLYIFSSQDPANYYVILQDLIKAIRDGRISKLIGRAILKRLIRKGIPIDPDLIDAINS